MLVTNNNSIAQFVSGNLEQWKVYHHDKYVLWLAGDNLDKKYKHIFKSLNSHKNISKLLLKTIVEKLDDHFGIICIAEKWAFAAVDCIRSYPIFWKKAKNKFIFSPQAVSIISKEGESIDSDQLTAFRMSGYSIDDGTLWQNINSLNGGNYIYINNKSDFYVESYFSYTPWKPLFKTYTEFKKQLKNEINTLLKNIIVKSNGRTIVIPLSAGLDSRLIVSGLKHLNYKKVKCFSYGLKNNFESKMSSLIANKLGYRWKFIEINQKIAKNFYKSKNYKYFMANSNDGCATSTIQGLYSINKILQDNYICKDDIIINGNSGDFISGGHVPKNTISNSKDIKKLFEEVFDEHYRKHYGLWPNLMNKNNEETVKSLLFNQLIKNIDEKDIELEAHGIAEFLEYQNRQTKYVINSQRIYEFYNLKWQLPLWEKSFIKFWSSVPLKYKTDQKLYKDVLRDLNMGGVWGREFDSTSYVSPKWIRFLRVALKVYFLFVGKNKWHNFEKKYLEYWTDNICGQSILPYKKIVNNENVSRHYVSWLTIFSEEIVLNSNWQKLDIGNDFKI